MTRIVTVCISFHPLGVRVYSHCQTLYTIDCEFVFHNVMQACMHGIELVHTLTSHLSLSFSPTSPHTFRFIYKNPEDPSEVRNGYFTDPVSSIEKKNGRPREKAAMIMIMPSLYVPLCTLTCNIEKLRVAWVRGCSVLVDQTVTGATPLTRYQFERCGFFCIDHDTTPQKVGLLQ